jgi:hypothetical protein
MADGQESLAGWARGLAEQYLADTLPRRWSHVQGVAAQAETLGPVVGDDADLLVAAAWLHDLGYAPDLSDTGFHPIDGANHLRRLGVPGRLSGLVAHHSCALLEANLRGLADHLEPEFPREESATADALWYADLTTGPDGQRFAVEERLDEIEARYGPGDLVTQFIQCARPDMVAAVRRTEARLAAHQPR